MSITNAKNGSVIENRAAYESTSQAAAIRPTTDLFQDQGAILAQIPDLDQNIAAEVPQKRLDGRIISQSLSIKLVLGLGLGLVIGAILPYVFGKASRPGSAVKELPAWSSNGGSPGIAGNTQQTMAPAWLPSPTAPATTGAGPQTVPAPAPAILMPQPPQVGDPRPTALTEPAWQQSRPLVAQGPAVTPSPAPNYDSHPPVVNTYQPGNRAGYRDFDRDPRPASGYSGGADPRNVQADNRSDTAGLYRNNDTRDYRDNPIDAAPVRRDAPASGFSPDPRYDNGGRNYPPATGPGNPLMPSSTPGATSTYSNPPVSEPGVARFDGTIATPPVRTSYDRAGSSNN